ncbi:F-box protein [Pajaroellobacter abortibovis]|uniref:F-box domain-containing protein n=1 Tax=Pajaroellobacter abortibovis TaxID=1882918 RepID=A0A1L6MY85_9BACT|nr:F-box protein [Pajaroellobacter abortibovis]APS00456.1 hypothetical protein BCY86_07035 [Pajaroellobacter abortibovis]
MWIVILFSSGLDCTGLEDDQQATVRFSSVILSKSEEEEESLPSISNRLRKRKDPSIPSGIPCKCKELSICSDGLPALSPFDYVSDDVLIKIFERLPIAVLDRLRHVNHRFRAVIEATSANTTINNEWVASR